METLGSCIRIYPDGRKCGNPVPGARGTYVVVNAHAFESDLCRTCTQDLLTAFLTGARIATWRKYPPTVAPDGTLWETVKVRKVLADAGFVNLAPASGPMRPRALTAWYRLLELFPDLLERVTRGEVFTPQQLARIHSRILENRESATAPSESVE